MSGQTTEPNSPSPRPNERAIVLDRIRAAMRTPTSHHVRHGPAEPDRRTYHDGLPFVDESWPARRDAFAARCENLRTRLHVVENLAEMKLTLASVLTEQAVKRIAYASHPLIDAALPREEYDTVCVDCDYDRAALERCEVGVTSCYALIAQTGSVMVTSRAVGGRTVTVLPPHHIVLATADQLLPNLSRGYDQFLNDPQRPQTSMLSLISGPSRTGDIERILVLGAHGPKQLTVILSENNH